MFMPVSGKILEVNKGLEKAPDSVNKDPYGEGWMIKIEMTNPSELDKLMDVDAYQIHGCCSLTGKQKVL